MSDDIKIEFLNDSQITQNDSFISFKIIIIGDSGVGKSWILKRAVQNTFEGGYRTTIGFEFLLMHFQANEIKIKLQIWDTCGEEKYKSLIQGFYKNTSLALIVYAINEKMSFDSLKNWIQNIKEHSSEDIPIFLVGNKSDLERTITIEEAEEFANSNRIEYFEECSAKTGKNVKEIFFEITKFLYKTYKEADRKNMLPSSADKLKINKNNNNFPVSKKKKCCKWKLFTKNIYYSYNYYL